nr:EOG090X0BKO [Eulimnadia texana]
MLTCPKKCNRMQLTVPLKLLRSIILKSINAASCTTYFVLLLSTLLPICFLEKNLYGHCLLFSRGTWRETDGQFVVEWASRFYCGFATCVGILQCCASIIQLYKLGVYLYRGIDSSFLSAFVDTVGSALLCLLSITAALMITLGFNTWCQDITQRFEECSYAEDEKIDVDDKIDTSNFYLLLGTAQFGAWASWACWIGLAVCAFLKSCRYHEQENIRVSMAKERRRVLTDGLLSQEGLE